MSDPIQVDTEWFLKKIDILNNLQRVLFRENQCYLTVLHHRYGVGLTEPQFVKLVQILVERKFCTCATGERGGILITLSDEVKEARKKYPEGFRTSIPSGQV
jgi:hypothetical protein